MIVPRPLTPLIPFLLIAGSVLSPVTSEAETPKAEESAPICHTCGASISGVYYKIPGLPELYCEECNKSFPHCFFCGRPVRGTGEGSRTVCSECQRESIQEPQEAQRLVRQVRDWIVAHLRLQLPAQVNADFVKDLAPHVGVRLLGTTRELGAFVREGEEVRILLITGMPKATLIETAAHELAHVWQEGRIPKGQRLLVKEGFAQWAASKVLDAFGCQHALMVLQKREDLYGQGYRILQAVENRRGQAGAIYYAKRSE